MVLVVVVTQIRPTPRLQARGPHHVRMTSVSTPSSATAQEALKRLSLLKDNDFTAKAVRDMIAEVEGRKPRKKKAIPRKNDCVQHCVQFWSGIQCDDQLRNCSAQNLNTTVTSTISNSSLAPRCREHPPEGKDESPTGKCTDDGTGLVKTLSGRPARNLQRSASLVNAVLSGRIHTVLDAATIDRCDFVEICHYDAPCLTEAIFVLLATGNHDAQTREKMRNDLRRLGSSGHCSPEPFDTLQSSGEIDFSTVFRVCCSSLASWWTYLLGMACQVHRLVFCRAA